jgi:hypothetical protein
MADKIDVRFTGESQDLENKVAKLEDTTRKLKEALKKVGEEGKNSGNVLQAWGQAQLGTITGMATGYLTVSKAIGVIANAHDKWEERIKSTAVAAKDLFGRVNAEMYKAGGFSNTRGWIDSVVKDREVLGTRREVLSAVAAAREAMPGSTSTEQREVAMKSMYRAPALGGDEQLIGDWTKRIGSLRAAGIGGTAQQSAEYAYAAHMHDVDTGDSGFSSGARALVNAKLATPAQAIAIAAQFGKAGIGTEQFAALTGKLTQSAPRTVSSPEQALEARILRRPEGERLQAVFSDKRALEQFAGARLYGKAQQLNWEEVQKEAADVEQMVGGNAYLRSIQRTETGDLESARLRRFVDLGAMKREVQAKAYAKEREQIEAAWDARGTPQVVRDVSTQLHSWNEYLGWGEGNRARNPGNPLPAIPVQLSPEDRALLQTTNRTNAALNARRNNE